jgi:hypothetical protein
VELAGGRDGSREVGIEIPSHHPFKIGKSGDINSEVPLEDVPHIPFHPLDAARAEHVLEDTGPEFVGVCVVADNFRGYHESGNKEAVARGEAGGGKAVFEALEEDEGGEGDGGVEFGAVEGIGNEAGQSSLGKSGGEVIRQGKEVGNKAGAETRYVFVGVCFRRGVRVISGELMIRGFSGEREMSLGWVCV